MLNHATAPTRGMGGWSGPSPTVYKQQFQVPTPEGMGLLQRQVLRISSTC